MSIEPRERSPRLEVASAILLDMSGRFLLQQRDNSPGILHPGKISLFGGHREAGESYLQCVVRELFRAARLLPILVMLRARSANARSSRYRRIASDRRTRRTHRAQFATDARCMFRNKDVSEQE